MSERADEGQETPPTRRTYSPAEAAADRSFYLRLKRAVWLGTLLVAIPAAAILAAWNPWYAISLAVGAVAGIANGLLSMYGNERLLDRRNVLIFVISSFGRIGLFGIVPVILAVKTPSVWTLGWYFTGFFVPLVFSGIIAILRERSG